MDKPATMRVRLQDGRTVNGTLVRIASSNEPWSEYLADDGTVIKAKIVARQLIKLEGEYDQWHNPSYVLDNVTVIVSNSPESLRKPFEDVSG